MVYIWGCRFIQWIWRGPCTGYRFPIDARLSNRTFAKFHVDVCIGDAVLDDPVWVKGFPLLDFAGIPAARVPLLPAKRILQKKFTPIRGLVGPVLIQESEISVVDLAS